METPLKIDSNLWNVESVRIWNWAIFSKTKNKTKLFESWNFNRCYVVKPVQITRKKTVLQLISLKKTYHYAGAPANLLFSILLFAQVTCLIFIQLQPERSSLLCLLGDLSQVIFTILLSSIPLICLLHSFFLLNIQLLISSISYIFHKFSVLPLSNYTANHFQCCCCQ